MMRNVITAGSDPVALAQSAAAWLSRIGYRVSAGAPTFGPRIPTYHDLADPEAPAERRLSAARRMLAAIERHIIVEEVRFADTPEPFAEDPHGIELRTTERGVVLELIAALLQAAIEALEQGDFVEI